MNIDWGKAPEGATHWKPENARLMAAWIKTDQGYYWFRMPYMTNWVRYDGPISYLGELISKPTATVAAAPKGATHKWSASGQFAKRCGGKTWAIWQDQEWLWIGDEFKGEMQELFDAAKVRKAAIEQLIADLRLTNGNGWYSIAEDLYDRGYRKFEIVEDDV